jgi:glycosyltransferase involved in cell wall biosynthesis
MKLRLGIVHWAFPPVIGGVEMHLLTVCPEMVRQGAEVYVLCGSVEGSPNIEVVEGVHVERTDGMVPSIIKEAQRSGQDIYDASKKMFDKFLDSHGIDVVQAHNLHMDFYNLSRALKDACTERSVPCYLVIHNDVFIDRAEDVTWQIIEKISWDRLVPISRYIRDTMGSKMPDIPGDKWTVIMHGINIDQFTPVTKEEKEGLKKEYGFEGRKVILHPARFLPWKGILPAIKSMPRVIKEFPTVLMVMTGRAERIFDDMDELARYDSEIDKFIKDNNLSENIHIGSYTHHDIPRLTSLCDILVYTTIGNEPFGLCPVEGMACKVPVIVTRSGGLVESVVHGKTGFVIDRDEDRLPKELADRIIELLSNQSLVKEFGENGRKRVEEMFDKRQMAKDFIRLSEELIRRQKPNIV